MRLNWSLHIWFPITVQQYKYIVLYIRPPISFHILHRNKVIWFVLLQNLFVILVLNI